MASKWSLLLLAILLDAGKERERERVLAAVHQFLMYIHRQKKSRNKRRKKEEEGKNNCQSSGNKKPRRK